MDPLRATLRPGQLVESDPQVLRSPRDGSERGTRTSVGVVNSSSPLMSQLVIAR